jgi:hypothetical protein
VLAYVDILGKALADCAAESWDESIVLVVGWR